MLGGNIAPEIIKNALLKFKDKEKTIDYLLNQQM